MSYLLVSSFQNYGYEQEIYIDKDVALKAYEEVQKHPGAFSANLYKLKLKESWVK